jgi:hypothetical protein
VKFLNNVSVIERYAGGDQLHGVWEFINRRYHERCNHPCERLLTDQTLHGSCLPPTAGIPHSRKTSLIWVYGKYGQALSNHH